MTSQERQESQNNENSLRHARIMTFRRGLVIGAAELGLVGVGTLAVGSDIGLILGTIGFPLIAGAAGEPR